MTNSIDDKNPKDNKNSEKKDKKKKKQGPIRWGALGFIGVMATVVAIYAVLFFDSNLRMALEFFGTRANKAEVNIGSLKTGFFAGTLKILDIQVTDEKRPQNNKVQIGEMFFDFSWDALLRAKGYVEDASILNIQIGTPRTTPGRVVKQDPKDSAGSVAKKHLKTAKKAGLKVAQEELAGNVLGDIAGMMETSDPTSKLKEFEGQMKSVIRVRELESMLEEKEKLWKERIDALPKSKDLKALNDRIKAINPKKIKTPRQAKDAIKKINSIVKEGKSKARLIKESGKSINSDISVFGQSFEGLKEMAEKDIEDLEKRIQIPELDTKDLANKLFRKYILGKYAAYEKYIYQVREYLPGPKKKGQGEEAEKEPAHVRGKGKNYRFGTLKSYPLFTLAKGRITSRENSSPFSGDIDGMITDLTTDPKILGRPTRITLKGDFPKKQIFGFDSLVTIDHTEDLLQNSFVANVASYPAGAQKFVESQKVTFGVKKAQASTNIKGELTQGILKLKISNKLKKVDYDIKSKSKLFGQMLKDILKDVPVVNVDAYLTGDVEDPSVSIKSNLAQALKGGFKKQVNAKVAEAKKRIRQFVDKKLNAKKDALLAKYDNLKGKYLGQVNKLTQDAKGSSKEAKSKISKIKKGQTKKILKKLKKIKLF